MYNKKSLDKMNELFGSAFEYSIMETNPTGTFIIGYCNEADDPKGITDKLNHSGSTTSLYTYVKNEKYSTDAALEFVEELAEMLRNLGPSILSSISLAELAMRYHESTVV